MTHGRHGPNKNRRGDREVQAEHHETVEPCHLLVVVHKEKGGTDEDHDHADDVRDGPCKADGNEAAIRCSVEAVEGSSTGCVLLLKNGDAEPVKSLQKESADMEEDVAPPKQNRWSRSRFGRVDNCVFKRLNVNIVRATDI